MHQPLPLSGSLLAERQVPKQAAAQACKRPSSHRPVQAHAQAGTGRGEPYPVVHAQAQAGNGSGKQAGKGPSMVIGWHRCWLSSCFCLCLPVCLHIFASLFVWYLGVPLHLSACLSPHYACFASTPLPCSCLCPTALPQSMPLPQSLPVPQYLSLPQSLLPQTLPLPQSLSICKPRSLLPSMRPWISYPHSSVSLSINSSRGPTIVAF